jgi:hypothetical protein
LPVSHFLHQNETTAGLQDTKIKFSLKINSPYCVEVAKKRLRGRGEKSIALNNNLYVNY